MKPLAILLFSSLLSIAAETSRNWMDVKGRVIKGQLVAKTTDTATLMLASGKRVPVKLETLSKDDQDYVAKADLKPVPRMLAKTVAVKSNEAGTKADERKVTVDVSDVHDRPLKVRIVWIGDSGGKNDYGVAKADEADVASDRSVEFAFKFGTGAKFSRNYKGYAVELLDEDGASISQQGSIQPLVRFLDGEK